MKAMMMSIRPKYVEKILNQEKTIEIRKRFPADYVGWVYIYCTKQNDLFKSYIRMGYCTTRSTADDLEYNGKGRVVARFYCDKVEEYVNGGNWTRYEQVKKYNGVLDLTDYLNDDVLGKSCLTEDELYDYCDDLTFSAINITKLEIFDKPKEISEFYKGFRNRYYKNNFAQDIHKEKNALVQPIKCGYEYTYKLTKAPQNYVYIEG